MLIIQPICGKFEKDMDFFGKMDPYVIIRIGNKEEKREFKTKVAKGMGKNPIWSDKFNYKFQDEKEFKFQVYDKDKGVDDYLGLGVVNLEIFLKRKDFSEWIPVYNKGKESGKVLFKIQVEGNIYKIEEKKEEEGDEKKNIKKLKEGEDEDEEKYNKKIKEKKEKEFKKEVENFHYG